MTKHVYACILALLLVSSPLHAQSVNQGFGGDSPWLVSQPDMTVSGTITNAAPLEISTNGLSVVGIHIEATVGSPHYVVEAMLEDAGPGGPQWSIVEGYEYLYTNIVALMNATNASPFTSEWVASVSGFKKIRVRVVNAGTTVFASFRGNVTGSRVVHIGPVQQSEGFTNAIGHSPWIMKLFGTLSSSAPAQVSGGQLWTAPAISTTANPSWSDGDQNALSIDLSGFLRTKMSSWLGSTAPTVGAKTSANSIPMVLATDQAAIPITDSHEDITSTAGYVGDEGATTQHFQSLQIGGAPNLGGQWRAVKVTNIAPDAAAWGLVTRPRSNNVAINEGLAVANDGLGNVSAYRNATTGGITEPAIRTDEVVAGDKGIIARIIPSANIAQPISASSLPLPTLAATSTLQTTGNNSLASIDTKLTSPLTVTANAGTSLNTSLLELDSTAVTGNASLAGIKTDVDPLVAPSAGGYVRQDSTGTIAKETGGTLSTIATNTKQRGSTSNSVMVMATDQDTQLLASNTARVFWQACNQSRSPMFLKFGAGASRFSYNVLVNRNTCYTDSSYMGQVDAAWDIGADQFVMVSETN